MNTCRTTRAVAVLLLVIMVLPPMAQARQLAARADNAVGDASVKQLTLLVGRSAIIRTDRPITRVSLSTSDIADALVTTPYELLVHGKTPGTISLLIWADNGRIQTYDVAVRRDLSPLAEQFRTLFPGEAITVTGNGKDVVLSGVVSSKYIVDRASSLAVGYVDKPENVVNLIRQQEGVATNQIMLKVRFAEVGRSAVQELGVSFFTGANGAGNWVARGTTQQFPAPTFDTSANNQSLVFSDFLNLFAFNTEKQIGALVKALKTKGLFESLAEPNLITQDGKEASFLAGGEYPYPVLQGTGATAGITIMFKEFGVRLKFTPTVTGDDMIQLKVAPEVSTLDFANAVTIQGFRVPALSTRRTETQVELRDGQTFAIAGLLDHTVNQTLSKVPGIGDIPILGYLFKSQAYQKNNTELVVMITPHIIRRDSPGVTPTLPGEVEPFLPDTDEKRTPAPAPAFTTPLTEQQTQPVAPVAKVAAPAAGASAADAVRAPASGTQARKAQAAAVVAQPAAVDRSAAAANEKSDKAQREELAVEGKQADQQRKREAEQARLAAVAEAKRADQQKKQDAELARQEQERARAAAQGEAAQAAKDLEALNRARKADLERQQVEQKLADKQAAEQAVIDRKRWTEQQAEAAKVKELSDKLAKEAEQQRKEQEKLAQEQSVREAELSRLIEQYKKLTTPSK
ncbi:MAG TPA: pilus assembly protein N-terminal domain-containing protein [Vicinamibacterales bacterium]|nr:pilus assembly protein N-terminal domain-containing protein [Vicinamibacterales bacterium]